MSEPTIFGLPVKETPDLPHYDIKIGMYQSSVRWKIQAIYAHPDCFKAGIGDSYEGIPLHADPTISMNEIHLLADGHYIKLVYKDDTHATP